MSVVKRLGALVVLALSLGLWPTSSAMTFAAPPDTGVPDSTPDTGVDGGAEGELDGGVETTVPEPEILEPDAGAATPAPAFAPSAPLIQIPAGCPSPEVARVIFVGRIVAKDQGTARFQVSQVRAGSGDGFIVSDLIDIRYDDETQYLDVGDRLLVGAAIGDGGRLYSKVQATDLLFGGDAVIGVAESRADCPVVEDQIRTLRTDGTEVETSMFIGLGRSKSDIALAFAKPLAVVFAVIVALVLIRWLFTAIFVAVRRAADVEPVTAIDRSRQHLPDL